MSVPASSSQLSVLIFLESDEAADRIRSALARYGLNANVIAAGQSPKCHEAADWGLVVTYTAMIGHVRSLLDVPVVNIETFFFERPDPAGSASRRQFDGAAFIRRIFSILSAERRLA
ncbi:hypothetical protein [Rhizobium sp. SYY.PMSO]|uniref:hypothetical protein n=1 Tax=Rhizobium sp. SYY.PMSO TaxID=3382192 RepID=UPI00398FC8C5